LYKPLRPGSLPRNVDIEITNLCQLQCDMCPRQGFKKERDLGHMNAGQFQHILNELKGVPCLSFSGNGEATIHPEFLKFFRMALDAGKVLTISTNGLGLIRFSEDELKELVKGFCTIGVSVDSPYKERYEAIRKGASYEQLMKGIKRLVKIKATGKAIIYMHLVYRGQEKKELKDMIELVKGLGLNKITIGKLMHYEGSAVREKKFLTQGEIRELKKFASERQIEIIFNFYKNFGLIKKFVGCNWPWRYAFISYEGIVTPCCSIKDPTRINLGNIFEENFKTIWHGERFVEFRKGIRSRSFPALCRKTRCWFIDRDFSL